MAVQRLRISVGARPGMEMNVCVELFGIEHEVVIERLPESATYRASGSVMGQSLRIERRGYKAALSEWKAAAARKLQP